MRVFIVSSLVAIILAVLGFYAVNSLKQTSDQAFSSATSVRFPHEESGHNLVGKDWSSAKEH